MQWTFFSLHYELKVGKGRLNKNVSWNVVLMLQFCYLWWTVSLCFSSERFVARCTNQRHKYTHSFLYNIKWCANAWYPFWNHLKLLHTCMEPICPFKTMVNGLVLIWPHSAEVEHSKSFITSLIHLPHTHSCCTMSVLQLCLMFTSGA